MLDGFGDPHRFFSVGDGLAERPEFAQATGQEEA
jgi:hypothetical protein